jgi:predicted alpha/beta hydrolase family esterase
MAVKHVIIVHGGSCWTSYAEYLADLKATEFSIDFTPRRPWQKNLGEKLGSGFKVLGLEMPNWQNAKYQEWKIWFEKAMAVSERPPVVVGHSLGGIFLTKYFSETASPREIKGMFLVGTPYRTHAENPDFGDFALKGPPVRLKKLGDKIHFYHGEDDSFVPFTDLKKYQNLLPEAVIKTFKNRGHFVGNNLPELARDIRSLYQSATAGKK